MVQSKNLVKGFLKFKWKTSAQKAVQSQTVRIDNSDVYISKAEYDYYQPENCILIENLPLQAGESDMKLLFGDCGRIINIKFHFLDQLK